MYLLGLCLLEYLYIKLDTQNTSSSTNLDLNFCLLDGLYIKLDTQDTSSSTNLALNLNY